MKWLKLSFATRRKEERAAQVEGVAPRLAYSIVKSACCFSAIILRQLVQLFMACSSVFKCYQAFFFFSPCRAFFPFFSRLCLVCDGQQVISVFCSVPSLNDDHQLQPGRLEHVRSLRHPHRLPHTSRATSAHRQVLRSKNFENTKHGE